MNPFPVVFPNPLGLERRTKIENTNNASSFLALVASYNPFEKSPEKVKKTDKIKEMTKEIGIKRRQKCNNLRFLSVFLPAFLIVFLSFLLFLVARPFKCQVTKITNGVYTGNWTISVVVSFRLSTLSTTLFDFYIYLF